MDIKITTQKKEGYLYNKSSGTLNSLDDWIITDEFIGAEVIKYKATHIVVDQQDVVFPKDNPILKALQSVNFYLKNFPPEAHGWKIAVVLNSKYKELGRFWETACINRGYDWYVFYNLDDAIDWVTQD